LWFGDPECFVIISDAFFYFVVYVGPLFMIFLSFRAPAPRRPDQTLLIVDFLGPDRPAKMLAAVLPDYGPPSSIKVQLCADLDHRKSTGAYVFLLVAPLAVGK